MIRPLQLARFIKINATLIRHTLTRPVLGRRSVVLRVLSYLNPWSFSKNQRSRGAELRIALEKLGPIFVKFGQLLSTRRDLLPNDIADELAKLQDQVPPFSGRIARQIIEKSFDKSINSCFATFDEQPLASASIAQVHTATLAGGERVIVKVLRPNIHKTIGQDISLMYLGARLAYRFSKQAQRLRPVELVKEFEQTITDELDLMREAANASQLRRNFADSSMMYVPKVYWQYIHHQVMVMERIHGIRISDVAALKKAGANLKKLAEYGVIIFFTQVLRDSFFHADMHPGNLFVDVTDPQHPKYIGVDFGIMGTLSPEDQRYLAENLLAFFNRDYRRVAVLHVESGWVPADTRIDQFEAAIRSVCEPIIERPLKDISFGQLLLRLFRTAERFNTEVQPQLMLLQKTLLSIEGLGRQLYPDLDLWTTAKPFLEKWLREQNHPWYLGKAILKEFPEMSEQFIKSPRYVFQILQYLSEQFRYQQYQHQHSQSKVRNTRSSRKRDWLLGGGSALAAVTVVTFIDSLTNHIPTSGWQWLLVVVSVVCLIAGWITTK